MDEPITIHAAKTHLSRLIARAEAGEEIIIARGRKPVVKLVAIETPKPQRVPGRWKGVFTVGPEFFEPMSEEELALWYGDADLLDTHVLLWWFLNETAISPMARAAIGDDANEIFVSAASVWEITIKYKTGKLPDAAPLMANLGNAILDEGFDGIPIVLRHGELAGSLPLFHKDPFDRMLIAQAMAESLTLVSNERLFDRYGVARLW